jgi:hypothetical protein
MENKEEGLSARALEVRKIFRDRDIKYDFKIKLTREEEQQKLVNVLKNERDCNLYKKLTVAKLKEHLKLFELPTSGNKPELFKRLLEKII